MPAFVKIWIHAMWSTKNREHLILSDLKYQIYDHIRENAMEQHIHLDFINGVSDHVHLLISLRGDQSVSKVLQLIKGESSHWVNTNTLSKKHFEWQNEYIAVSVSESIVPRVREYIRNQEQHHRKNSYIDEYDAFIKKYRFNSAQ